MTIHFPAQLLIKTTVGPDPSYCQERSIGEVIKEGSCVGHQQETETRGRFRHSFGGPGNHPALGQWVSWRSQVIDCGQHPVML